MLKSEKKLTKLAQNGFLNDILANNLFPLLKGQKKAEKNSNKRLLRPIF
jgi:hypothetical protein